MRTLVVAITTFFLSSTANSQNFSQAYQNTGTLDSHYYDIQQKGTQYTFGLTTVEPSIDFRKKVKLLTTNLSGVIANAKLYEATDANYSISINKIVNLADDTQLISGLYSANNSFPYEPYIMLLNADGSVNWAKKLTTNNANPATLKQLSDNSFLVVFKSDTFTVCKVDLNGNFTSFKSLSNTLSGDLIAVNSYATNFELLLGSGDLINISNDLSTVNWQRKYFHSIGITYNRTSNGDYIYASSQVAFPGHMTVFRTTSTGTLIWATYIETWKGAVQNQNTEFDIVGFNFIKEDINGTIVTSASSEGGSNGSLTVTLDANGTYLSNTKIETFQNKTTLTTTDDYLIAGFATSASYNVSNFIVENRNLSSSYYCDLVYNHSVASGTDMPMTPDAVVLTPTSVATQAVSVTFSATTVSQNDYCGPELKTGEHIKTEELILAYPNPVHNELTLKSSTPIKHVSIYNALGQEIQNTTKTTIDTSNWADGIYFVKITTENNHYEIKKISKN